jgi:putative transcriptional regulator
MKKYHYKECGLKDVYLLNGFTIINDEEYGECVSINNRAALEITIAKNIINLQRPLIGEELRFLRKAMNLSQKSLGEQIGLSEQTIARWEKDESKPSRSEDAVIRNLYCEYINTDSRISFFLKAIAHAEAEAVLTREMNLCTNTQGSWEVAA